MSLPSASSATASMSSVSTDAKEKNTDAQKAKVLVLRPALSSMMKNFKKGAPRGKANLTRTHLALVGNQTSSAATALASVISIDPSSSSTSSFSDLSAIFDEYRLAKTRIRFLMYTSSGGPLIPSPAFVVYDPTFKTALASLAEAAQYDEPYQSLVVLGSAGATAQPSPETKTGLFSFEPPLVKGDAQLLSASQTIQTATVDQWQETSSTVTQVPYGYYKFWLPAQGTGTTITLQYVVDYWVDFRFRNN